MAEELCLKWNDLHDNEISSENIQSVLSPVQDDLWVAAACADRLLDDTRVQRELLDLGLSRTESAPQRVQDAILTYVPPTEDHQEEEDPSLTPSSQDALTIHFRHNDIDRQLCRIRALLLDRLDRLLTYQEMVAAHQLQMDSKEETGDAWEDPDDPWADPDEEGTVTKEDRDLFSLPTFLILDISQASFILASLGHFKALEVLYARYASSLRPFRFQILEYIPNHISPTHYRNLLPACDPSSDFELFQEAKPWREVLDWVESETVQRATQLPAYLPTEETPTDTSELAKPLSGEQLSAWYKKRVEDTETTCGMIGHCLALIQHGASQNVPDLDQLGEDLNLLARLVYDAPQPDAKLVPPNWTLAAWRQLEPLDVIRAYLAYATPENFATCIRRLVMPYLFVLESRKERQQQPDPELPKRLLYQYILQAPLETVAVILDASKPTLPAAQRLIKDDQDIARLALACLYGSNSTSEWSTMSRIFECLPVWSDSYEGDEDAADTTLASLGDFVTPSTAGVTTSPTDLLIFFTPLPEMALSRALDILDVHLESGEIFARWGVPAPLRWFLQSYNDVKEQRAWATRMVRRSGPELPENLDEWRDLLDDMLKLLKGGDGPLKGAFGSLSREEVTQIFFGGVLASGDFDIARKLLGSLRGDRALGPSVIENLCLTASREFYDNASSGNLYQGDMRLAYDCLSVASQSPVILKEKEFIEATSRICSFNVLSRSGLPMTPLEIRLVKDRLSLISQVLSGTDDAYKHSQVILDLADKLGFRGDMGSRIKVFAMLGDAALQAEDFVAASHSSEQMVEAVHTLQKHPEGVPQSSIDEAVEVCWHFCFQLGRQAEFRDLETKLKLLGQALQLCPSGNAVDVLNVWRRVEAEQTQIRRQMTKSREARRDRRRPEKTLAELTASSIRDRLSSFKPDLTHSHLVPTEAAAMASRTLGRVTASLPFGVARGRSDLSQDEPRARSQSPDVSAQARQVLSKGIGWLIGGDDE
ncbi:hypothetical protein SISNIDRAFT_438503 [Sistotremastrum niveocremeum HHB9708]|uniref:Sec39 domain-containing protein n=2 Tax=Sistotremastraceae TaxID=3402574 RepID=A0A164XG11_9AGAM|nr:hypothetical protein SISNIDRAFT_438503 [Sistotremastrum niveocremeum HHB9708]KZT41335.1 hypothetical protein SISSUDRAFT_1059478 [Sistotremastrum suecicum HHB10207 ss-3]